MELLAQSSYVTGHHAMLIDSDALFKIQEAVASYINYAKERLETLADSDYKESLSQLADYVIARNY